MNNEDLKKYIKRIENLEERKQAVAEDIKQVYEEAKSSGFDSKALKQVIKIKKINENQRLKNQQHELDYLIEAYKVALGLE